jgi:NTE family protein
MQDRITRARLAGDPPDILISPRLANVGLFDFHRAADAIDQGRRATERALESIDEAIAILVPDSQPASDAATPDSQESAAE